ncbi:MAG: glycosyltransferase [Erysipelotrichaceae bacterium]|nr:glycosyltransferase [Erysipelotrichaceae bacterium]
MKIGQFSDSFLPIVDGVGRVVYNYCDTISNKGHQCYAIVPLADMGYRGQYKFEILDFYSRPLPKMPHYRAGIPRIDPHYHARLEMTNFDIVHLHSPFIAGMEAIHYAKKHKIPLVGTFHSKFYDDFLQLTKQEFLADIGVKGVLNVFDACTEVWAVSETSANTLKEYGYQKPIHVMPNGMNKKAIPESCIINAKKKFNIDQRPILLYVGQINWKKNILRTLEAMKLLKQTGQNCQLLLVGQGPHEKEVKAKIKAFDIEDRVKMLGHILDSDLLDGLFASASLFVFPSLYDNAPMVVREAANAKTPTIVVANSNAAEVINPNQNGLYCQDDANDLAAVISKALNDPLKLKLMGENAQATILIAWDQIIDDVLARYEYLIKRFNENG